MKKRLSKLFGLLFISFFLLNAINAQTCLAANFDLKAFTSKYEKTIVFVTTYDEKGRKLASGSGFFINADGDFITNRHVIQGAVTATIETVTGEKYNLNRLLATKPDLDLVIASIETPKTPTPYLEIAKSMPAKGDKAIVFGNPLGVKFTVSEGIISGIQTFPNQEWPQLTQWKGTYVQFTAPISSGSSGGPILNEQGEVIGVTTWGFLPKISQNLNFAIPPENIQALIGSKPVESSVTDASVTPIPEKKKVALVVMYGPKLLEQIKSQEKRDQITAIVEEAISSEFRKNKYVLKPSKETNPVLEAYWKITNGFNKAPIMDDIDKATLIDFGDRQKFDVVVFAGIEMSQVKKASNIAYAASGVEVELDIRVTNLAIKEYSYAQILVGHGSDSFVKFWGWESPNMMKPTTEALTFALRQFRRDFSSDQIL